MGAEESAEHRGVLLKVQGAPWQTEEVLLTNGISAFRTCGQEADLEIPGVDEVYYGSIFQTRLEFFF